jgi:hypothetical protein
MGKKSVSRKMAEVVPYALTTYRKRTYIMTAKRIISGEVLKYRNELHISGDYKTRFASASFFALTMPARLRSDLASAGTKGSLRTEARSHTPNSRCSVVGACSRRCTCVVCRTYR